MNYSNLREAFGTTVIAERGSEIVQNKMMQQPQVTSTSISSCKSSPTIIRSTDRLYHLSLFELVCLMLLTINTVVVVMIFLKK
jgi:hypothetical protein